MSWWDASGFSSFATQALKNAQKKIDKVLDIQEDGTEKVTPPLKGNILDDKEKPINGPFNNQTLMLMGKDFNI